MKGPWLPAARGDLSGPLLSTLRYGTPLPAPDGLEEADPYGDDLQLTLYTLYELHYRGFAEVPDEREWDPGLLALRRSLELRFLQALRSAVPVDHSADGALDELLEEPVGHDDTSVSHHLQRDGELWQFQEYAALRSLYHLKEADPHAWVIPRLQGRAKAAMVAVEYDEFGAGREEDVHARLFAELMADLGLRTEYGHYLDAAPAEALATVNLMSLLGLHRALRGALVGHFAAVETTSSPDRDVWPPPCAGWGRATRPSASTTNTSRPTPCTNRSYATTSSAVSWRTNPNSNPTSRSVCGSPVSSKTGSPRTCWPPGGTGAARCASRSTPPRDVGPEAVSSRGSTGLP